MVMKEHRHIGVYGVIILNNKILLIEKARGPYKGTWDLPGGGIEFSESPLQALHREINEETGYNIHVADLIKTLSNVVTYKNSNEELEKLHHLEIIYRVEINKNNNIKSLPDGEDSLGARWLDLSQIDKLKLSPFVEKIINKINSFEN